MKTQTMSGRQIRDALRAKFGARKFKVHQDGSISAYGRMPNAHVTGWYLFGFTNDPQTIATLKG
jgi:hypothetical protein